MSQAKRCRVSVLLTLLGAVLPFLSAHAATYTPQEQANMKLVADFYAALDAGEAAGDLKKKIRKIAEQYLKEDYIQHMETGQAHGQGREGLIRMFEQMPTMPAPPAGARAPPPTKVLTLMVQGDLVVRISTRAMPAPGGKGSSTSFIFNMFRVQDGKLAEHWSGTSGPPIAGGPPGEPPGAPPEPR